MSLRSLNSRWSVLSSRLRLGDLRPCLWLPILITLQIDYLKIKLDDQEQYSRRTNLKISGIKEQGREENTDDLVLDVINNLILKHQGVSLNSSHIDAWVMQLWIYDHVFDYPYWLFYKKKSLCKQLRYIRFVYANNIHEAIYGRTSL
jgi:hypothetical protein